MSEEDTADSLIAKLARIPERRAPQTIGRYRILRTLGAGGMGVVYEAEDPELSRKVAIKLLHESRDDVWLRREAQTLARLTHPNVVTVFDVATGASGDVYIVMQLVDGTTLDRHVAGKPVDAILAAFADAGRGLVAAHAEGIVHRDFKPANVLVGRDGTVRVSDFGLASSGTASIAGDATALTTAAGIGTPAYMAPEQFAAGVITAASDQFAFCVALWEALYGERPFGGSTYTELSSAVTRGDRREPREDRAVPRHIRAALLRGLSIGSGDRFPSLTALLAELAQADARPPSRGPRVAIVAAVGMLALAAIAWFATRSAADPCDAVSARDWTPTLIAAASRGSVDDVQAVARFVDRWPDERRDACRVGPATERQAICLDASLGKLERSIARRTLRTERWGETRVELPLLERCRAADPDRAPVVTPIATRHTVGDPPTGYALGPGGRIAVATPRTIEILAPTGAHVAAVASPHIEPTELFRWTDQGLLFNHSAMVEILDPETGATQNNFVLPAGARAISRDGKQALVEVDGSWALAPIAGARDVPRARIETSDGALAGVTEWSPDDRRIASIAVTRRGPQIATSLRVIDVASRTAVDSWIRLEHGIVQGVELVWLDDHRILLNGRVRPDAGEGLWIAHLDSAGRVIDWEERLPASANTAYVPIAVDRSHALAELLVNNDNLIRIHDGVVAVVSETIEAEPHQGLELSIDGERILIGTARGRGWVTLTKPSFTPVELPGIGRPAIDRDRVLAIADHTLYAIDATGTHSLGPIGGHAVRCDPTGTACVVFGYTGRTTRIRTLDPDITLDLDVEATDIAVAPDGRIAVTGPEHGVIVVDPQTGKRTSWTVGTFNCPRAAVTQFAAWSPRNDALYVTSWCGQGKSRIDRLAPNTDPRTVYEGPWVGSIAIAPDGDVLAIRRRVEAQPVVIEDL